MPMLIMTVCSYMVMYRVHAWLVVHIMGERVLGLIYSFEADPVGCKVRQKKMPLLQTIQ